jgi:DNA-binding CsgD family transcriptional regulator
VARGVLGFIELSQADPAAAARHLEPAVRVARNHGVEDPSVYPIWADAIEAFIGIGQLNRAESILEWLEERGRMLDRPWALATSARCRALLSAAKGDLAGALAAVETALHEHERLPRRFELGRTLLVKGRIARRVKQRRVAREALERAVEIFDELGAPLWSKQAGDELGRIGGRASGSALTPTQARIAELVAAGHTNREIADEMFVSVKTVEANLSKIYRKLGVSSRRELARNVGAGDGVGAVEQT